MMTKKQSPIPEQAEAFCTQNGHRLTDPRRYVLGIIAAAAKPIGAYDILARLGEYLDKPKPPTAYRAIEFWQEHGFIHRIESLNAYTVCSENHHHDGSQFLICDDCGNVTETHLCHLPGALQTKAGEKGFNVRNWSVELHGTCHECDMHTTGV